MTMEECWMMFVVFAAPVISPVACEMHTRWPWNNKIIRIALGTVLGLTYGIAAFMMPRGMYSAIIQLATMLVMMFTVLGCMIHATFIPTAIPPNIETTSQHHKSK